VVTLRSIAVGGAISVAIGAGVAYADNAIRGSYLALDFGSPAALAMLAVVVLFLNPVLGLVRRRWQLSGSEVAVVYIMALLATAIPSMGLTGFFLSYLTGAQYYASPENEWATLFLEHVPSWMIVQDPVAVRRYFEGNPTGVVSIPWGAWIEPLVAWGIFLGILYLVMVAICVLLRRQWMEHERLLYPLMQPSLALIERESGALLPSVCRSPALWVGMAIPLLVGLINGLHAYYEFIPMLQLEERFALFRQTTTVRAALSFTTLGFTYFLSSDISLGIWVFNVLAKCQEGAFNVLGIASVETMEWVTVPYLAHQSLGAMVVLVLWGLWTARRHLRSTVRTALQRQTSAPGDGDRRAADSDEIMSYRSAWLSLLLGFPTLWWWLWRTGMPPWAAAAVLILGMIIFVGLTRMVTEGGFFITRAPINPGNAIISGFGVESLGTAGVTGLGYSFVWVGEMRIFVMAACANALKVAQTIGGNQRRLLWVMAMAIGLSVAASVWMELALCYRYGGINLSTFHTSLVNYPFNFISRNLNNTTPINWLGWGWSAWGGALMGLLMLARQRFVWWPIHPISLPVSSMWMTDTIVLSVFLSWLIKLMLLRYGGPRLYERGKPLFIGLVVGQFLSMAGWVVIDGLVGMMDNLVWGL
jgi:hypothetical protein